jgi:hypothetical protein
MAGDAAVIVCVDLDGTISADPDFYRAAMAGLRMAGVEVHVLSGTHTDEVTPEEIAEKLALLAELGIVAGCEFDAAIAVAGPEKNVPANKVAYMRHAGASVLADNDKPNCKAARKAGFLALRHLSPKGA